MSQPEQNLTGVQWLNMENYLPVLAPDLHEELQRYWESDGDEPGIYEEVSRVQNYAHYMVRYALSDLPDDSIAHDIRTNTLLLDPHSQLPFTIEGLGIDRQQCKGPTTGVEGRERMIAELTVAMVRKIRGAGLKPEQLIRKSV